MEFYAFGAHFPDLPDEDKWKFNVQFARTNQPPTATDLVPLHPLETFAWHTAAVLVRRRGWTATRSWCAPARGSSVRRRDQQAPDRTST
jgi:hypothetical protein